MARYWSDTIKQDNETYRYYKTKGACAQYNSKQKPYRMSSVPFPFPLQLQFHSPLQSFPPKTRTPNLAAGIHASSELLLYTFHSCALLVLLTSLLSQIEWPSPLLGGSPQVYTVYVYCTYNIELYYERQLYVSHTTA